MVDSDSSANEEKYSKLAAQVAQLDSTQRVKAASRRELSSQVSEFNLPKAPPSGSIHVSELASVLGEKAKQAGITKKVKRLTSKAKTLPKPLEKPVADKIKRTIGFKNVKNQLKRWDAVVMRNRMRDHLVFPQNNTTLELQSSQDFLTKFKTQTPLEKAIAEVLQVDVQPVTEKEDEFPLTVEEMIEKRKEMAKLRAKQSYMESKAYRQSKIKSKKYHRILRKEKIKQQLKDFEMLQKTDPEAALKKLEQLDKTRAHERASLRHRSTGKWAKNLQVRAKYDTESRKVLAEQLTISKEMTQKVRNAESSDEEEGGADPVTELPAGKSLENNPWAVGVSSEVEEFVSGYRKYWEEKKKKDTNENSKVNHKAGLASNEIKKNGDVSELPPRPPQHETTKNVAVVKKKMAKKNETVMQNNLEKESNLKNSVEKLANKTIGCLSNCKTKLNSTGKPSKEKRRSKEKSENSISSKAHSNSETSKHVATQKNPVLINGRSATKAKKTQKAKRDVRYFIDMKRASGIWSVSPTADTVDGEQIIDDLFNDVENRLNQKIAKKMKSVKLKFDLSNDDNDNESTRSDSDVEIDLSMKKSREAIVRPDVDEELSEAPGKPGSEAKVGEIPRLPEKVVPVKPAPAEIDPNKFIKVKVKHLNTQLPDDITGGEDGIDDEEERHMTIMEAFGDDDVINEFREMKADEVKSTMPEEISTELPGWGRWAGSGIVKSNRRKRRRRLIDLSKLPPRKDRDKQDLIINEEENPNTKAHLIKELPFPFKTIEDYEASMRAPVGRQWVPETAHRRIIRRPIETQLGAVIDPMDEEELVQLKKRRKSAFKGKVKANKKK